jgi:hypothetical protein
MPVKRYEKLENIMALKHFTCAWTTTRQSFSDRLLKGRTSLAKEKKVAASSHWNIAF